jgi:hypothetical protein
MILGEIRGTFNLVFRGERIQQLSPCRLLRVQRIASGRGIPLSNLSIHNKGGLISLPLRLFDGSLVLQHGQVVLRRAR